MTFRIEDDQLDPDVFLKQAIEAKLSHINRRIDELMAAGRTGKQLESYISARAVFSELLRSPRLHLAKAAAPAPGSAATALAAAAQARGAAPRSSALPLGAIPSPRRVSAATAAAAFAAPGAAAAATPPAAAPAPVRKGMLGFLKNVQATSPPLSAAAASPSATPIAPAATPEAAAAAPAAAVQPAVAPETPARPHFPAAHPQPSPGAKAVGGGMQAFLQKMQKGLAAPVEGTSVADNPLPAAERQKIIDSLKKEASERGFADIYAMLQFKKKKLQESRKTLMQNPDENAARVVAVIDREIAMVDELLKEKPPEIARRMGEFKEVAAVNKQRVALEQELGGLLDELKG